MENKKLEFFILYLIVGCVIVVFAIMVRLFTLMLGFDDFTSRVLFFLSLGVLLAIYLSINVFLQKVMLPWIQKLMVSTGISKREIKINKPATPDNSDENALSPPLDYSDLDQLREKHIKAEAVKREKAREIAISYTKTLFAPFLSDEDIHRLCGFIDLYAAGKELNEVVPIKVSHHLTSADILHYGWNIWNHFKVSNQMTMAIFLKAVFADTLKEVSELETIRKKFRKVDGYCTIKLKEKLEHNGVE